MTFKKHFTQQQEAEILAFYLQESAKLSADGVRSTRITAKNMGVSAATVRRLLHKYNIRPTKTKICVMCAQPFEAFYPGPGRPERAWCNDCDEHISLRASMQNMTREEYEEAKARQGDINFKRIVDARTRMENRRRP